MSCKVIGTFQESCLSHTKEQKIVLDKRNIFQVFRSFYSKIQVFSGISSGCIKHQRMGNLCGNFPFSDANAWEWDTENSAFEIKDDLSTWKMFLSICGHAGSLLLRTDFLEKVPFCMTFTKAFWKAFLPLPFKIEAE